MFKQNGFSLIELMVVVIIIGILGSLAIPAYKDYVVRAKVTELFAVAQPAKLAVTEELMFGTPLEQISNEKLNIEKMANQGKIREMTIAAGIIKIVGNNKELDIPAGKQFQISLTPRSNNGTVEWSCKTDPVEFGKYAPPNCRGAGEAAGE